MSKFIFECTNKTISRQIFTFSKFFTPAPEIPPSSKSNRRNRSKGRENRNENYGKNFISGVVKIPVVKIKLPKINPVPVPDDIRKEILLKRQEAAFGLPKLSEEDCRKRAEFAESFLQRLEKEPQILDSLFFSDEGNFWPMISQVGPVPIKSKKRKAKAKKLYAESDPLPTLVWCAMNSKEVIGPYFFNSHVTDRSYVAMLKKYFLKELKMRDYNLDDVWYQQDGAPPHRSRRSLEFLKKKFDTRLLSHGVPPYTWPPRSNDLTPLDYFLWDYLKIRMNPYHPIGHDNLRDCLTFEVQNMDQALIQSEVEDFKPRLVKCLNAHGNRFEVA